MLPLLLRMLPYRHAATHMHTLTWPQECVHTPCRRHMYPCSCFRKISTCAILEIWSKTNSKRHATEWAVPKLSFLIFGKSKLKTVFLHCHVTQNLQLSLLFSCKLWEKATDGFFSLLLHTLDFKWMYINFKTIKKYVVSVYWNIVQDYFEDWQPLSQYMIECWTVKHPNPMILFSNVSAQSMGLLLISS